MNERFQPKLACTASGMDFEQWRRRPVYTAHCKTFTMAKAICGVKLDDNQGLASTLPLSDGLSMFRVLPPYRTPESIQLRTAVAKAIREQRRAARLPN